MFKNSKFFKIYNKNIIKYNKNIVLSFYYLFILSINFFVLRIRITNLINKNKKYNIVNLIFLNCYY